MRLPPSATAHKQADSRSVVEQQRRGTCSCKGTQRPPTSSPPLHPQPTSSRRPPHSAHSHSALHSPSPTAAPAKTLSPPDKSCSATAPVASRQSPVATSPKPAHPSSPSPVAPTHSSATPRSKLHRQAAHKTDSSPPLTGPPSTTKQTLLLQPSPAPQPSPTSTSRVLLRPHSSPHTPHTLEEPPPRHSTAQGN